MQAISRQSFITIITFITVAVILLRLFSKVAANSKLVIYFGSERAVMLRRFLHVLGYTTIVLLVLNYLHIPVGKLLLGGAAVGIILGVAAQQALGNFFASIVLTISRPFSLGEKVTITSGALGGQYIGVIKDISLTHTKLQLTDGEYILLPNSAVLISAAIIKHKMSKDTHKDE